MELTLQLKLLPTDDQTTALRPTMERSNEAYNWLAEQAFACQMTYKLTLQRLYYHALRSRFALSSQMAVRCLARVAGTYKRDPGLCPTLKPHAAMPYDQRIMRFHGLDQGSFLTLAGRVLVAFLVGTYHQECFDTHASRQCHLMLRDEGQWFLLVVVQVPDGTLFPPTDFLNRLWLRGVALSSCRCWLAATPATSSVLQGRVYDNWEELWLANTLLF